MADEVENTTGQQNQHGHTTLSISIACGVFETVAVALRFVARRKVCAKYRSDDWLLLLSLFPSYGMMVAGGFLVSDGKSGDHKDDLTHDQLVVFLKAFFTSVITYVITVTLVRVSILLLLRRIFAVKPFMTISLVIGALCLVWGVAIFFANIFQCTPFADAFNPDVVMSPSKKCINLQAMYYGTLGTAFALDLVILVLPLHQIWRLNLPTRKKFELMAIMSLGGIACVASIMRIVTIGNLRRTDLVYTSASCYMWSQIEPSAAIFGACIVTYRPLFRDVHYPGFFHRLTSAKTEGPTDVSRRCAATGDSEEGSEAGLVGNEGRLGED